MAKKTSDLPGIEGPGVAPVKIAEIETAAEEYIKHRDKRCAMTPKEIAAKSKLVEAIHKHQSKLGADGEGVVSYRYDDVIITLKPGKETLKVRDASDDSEEE